MYTAFFGLREVPFNNTPDPRFFYSTPDHEEALASLIYAVGQMKGFMLLTGEVGTGKTLLSRIMLAHFGRRIEFASITNTHVSADDLLLSICLELGIDSHREGRQDSRVGVLTALQEYLVEQFAHRKPVVLVLDEAQNLTHDSFEALRMISNFETDNGKLIQIVMIGQPELRDRLNHPSLRQLRQRIFRSFHLPVLDRALTEDYILHRLKVAGSEENHIFDRRAIDAIYEISQGVPRLINGICDNAMLSAYASDTKTIDAALIRSAVDESMVFAAPIPETDEQQTRDASVPVTTEMAVTTMPAIHATNVSERLCELERRFESTTSAKETTGPIVERLAAIEERLQQASEAVASSAERIRRLDRLEHETHTPITPPADTTTTPGIDIHEESSKDLARGALSRDPHGDKSESDARSEVAAQLIRTRRATDQLLKRMQSESDQTERIRLGLHSLADRLNILEEKPSPDRETESSDSASAPLLSPLDMLSNDQPERIDAIIHRRPAARLAGEQTERFRRLCKRADAVLKSRSPTRKLVRELHGLTEIADRLRIMGLAGATIPA